MFLVCELFAFCLYFLMFSLYSYTSKYIFCPSLLTGLTSNFLNMSIASKFTSIPYSFGVCVSFGSLCCFLSLYGILGSMEQDTMFFTLERRTALTPSSKGSRPTVRNFTKKSIISWRVIPKLFKSSSMNGMASREATVGTFSKSTRPMTLSTITFAVLT